MTDQQKLLVAYFSEEPEHHLGVTMHEVVSMLYQLGVKHRQLANEQPVGSTTDVGAGKPPVPS
jgi:hypothetical protein